MKFIKKLRVYAAYWLVRKLRSWMLKYALRLHLLAWHNVKLSTRLSDSNALQEGYDEHRDIIIHIAANKITRPEWFDQALSEGWERRTHDNSDNLSLLVSKYISNREEIDQLVNEAESDSSVKKWLIIYIRNQRYIEMNFGGSTDDRRIEYWDGRLAELGDTVKPIVAGDIGKLISQAKRNLKDSRSALSDREAFKISMNLKWVGSFISLLSVLLLISGFIYTYMLYDFFFGVPISLYFSVSDYVDSSIEQLSTVFFGVFVGLFAAFLGAHQTSRTPTIIVEEQRKKLDPFRFFAWSFIFLFTPVGFLVGGQTLHSIISITILCAGVLVAPYLVKKFFNERNRAFFLLFAIFAFTSRMYDTVYSNIYDILEGESVPKLCEQINITSDNDNLMPPCGSSVIGATKTHIFVFDKNKNAVVILSRSQLTQSVFNSSLIDENWANRLSNRLIDWVTDKAEKLNK